MTKRVDLEPALRKLHELSRSDGDIGGEYWESVSKLLRTAYSFAGRVKELEAELALVRAPRPQVLMSYNALRAVARDVFETEADGDAWLHSPHSMLDEISPRQVAKTLAGRQRVLEILVAIKYGLRV